MTPIRLAPLALLLSAATASAVPLELPHQGRVLGTDGVPLEGKVSLTVGLYDSATSEPARWSETFSVNAESGYYAVTLGRDTLNPLELSDLDGTPWLGILVNNAPLPPREPLAAVPLALVSASATEATHAANSDRWAGIALDPSDCTQGDGLRFDAANQRFTCQPWFGSGSIVNVTTRVNSTRQVMAASNSITLESFTVNKVSPTSYLFVQGTLTGWGNASGSIQQVWSYGGGADVLSQGVMYDDTNHGKVYPTTARIDSTLTGSNLLVFRYRDLQNNGGDLPFKTYNPNGTDDNRLNQTRSVYVVWEIEP